MEENTENSHKTILKSTSIFGFAQLMKMGIGVIASKFIAVFLGPIGIGIVGLLNNSLSIIASLTSFGINTIAVREVSLAKATNDDAYLSRRYIILKRWALIVGVFGAICSIVFSKLLSQWTFGNPSRYQWFILLSINFILLSLTSCKVALMQGLRMMRSIAISNVVNSFLVTLLTIPLYYFYKYDGIVPAILVSSAVGLGVNVFYTRKVAIHKIVLSWTTSFNESKPLMKLGFLLSINVIFGQICTFVIKLYLNGSGTKTEILGFYEVSTVILVSYVGMIFNAMGTDFYPRLTEVQSDNKKLKNFVNDQIEIGLLLVTPLLILFYFLAPILIKLLYSSGFIPVVLILKGALFAIIIKAIIWPLAFVILAKGENKLYFKQELLGDFLNIVSTIVFYKFFGLEGIGTAMLLNYILYGIYVYLILNKRFEFGFRKETVTIICCSCLLGFISCLVAFETIYPNSYWFFGVLFLISGVYSFVELNKRISVLSIIIKLKNKFIKK